MDLLDFPLTYTLCFLTREDKVLMLFRKYPPNANLWNGVGGRIEAGETPYDSCVREVEEETGYRVESMQFAGILTWNDYEVPDGGLYIFQSNAPDGEPRSNDEGSLEWLSRDFILTSPEVVDNIPHFIMDALTSSTPRHYHFSYRMGSLTGHSVYSLPKDFPWH